MAARMSNSSGLVAIVQTVHQLADQGGYRLRVRSLVLPDEDLAAPVSPGSARRIMFHHHVVDAPDQGVVV